MGQFDSSLEIIVILHNIRSIHNVGSIFRTADAAGIKKIYLCGITPGPLDRFGNILPQFVKVSLGAEKTVAYECVKSSGVLIKKLKKDGYNIFAVEQSKRSVPYYSVKYQVSGIKKIVLIFGNEVKGLPPPILKASDKILEIPMAGNKESLNVSVAFGIAAYGFLYN